MEVKLEQVSYRYKGKYQPVLAVSGVTYSFTAGKMYAIIGKSGSGKTTLLSLLAGLMQPSEGKILIGGREITDMDKSRLFPSAEGYGRRTDRGKITDRKAFLGKGKGFGRSPQMSLRSRIKSGTV